MHSSRVCWLSVTGSRSKLWATFNEPGVFAMCSYVAANHPPGMLMQFKVVAPAPLFFAQLFASSTCSEGVVMCLPSMLHLQTSYGMYSPGVAVANDARLALQCPNDHYRRAFYDLRPLTFRKMLLAELACNPYMVFCGARLCSFGMAWLLCLRGPCTTLSVWQVITIIGTSDQSCPLA